MGWLDKAKDLANQAKKKISEVDTKALIEKAKANSSDAISSVSKFSSQTIDKTKEKLKNIDTQQLIDDTKKNATDFMSKTKEFSSDCFKKAKSSIENIDWEKVTDREYQKENLIKYWTAGTNKIKEIASSTLEIDKDTMDMVGDLQKRLPVPAQTLDDIFDQCRNVSIQRACGVFFLSGVAEAIDNNSAEKYENLSESYKEYGDRIGGHNIRSHENFARMQDVRAEADRRGETLEDGYNAENILYPSDTDIEHVISAKETYESTLLRAGTKDKELLDAINSEDNLIFTNSSVNRSKGADSLPDFLERSEPHPTKEGVRIITINGETHEVNEADCKAALETASESLNNHKLQAAAEIGLTAAQTGVTMAIQQVVGMMVVETIDIFMDEIQRFTKNFKLFNKTSTTEEDQDLNDSLSDRLMQRFEEKEIWGKAKSLGIEAGISGALSVIPQILISTLTRLPAFALGMIREGTLSCVRCARILASNNQNKLQAIGIIMASTASAVAGLYVSRVISAAISGVPLLNRFNHQIGSVLSGLLVTAVPLMAIYLFDQNKNKLVFALTNKFQTQKS